MANILLAPFDPNADFVALREFLCRGHYYKKGEDFDRASVATRALRILYEGRSIGFREEREFPRHPRGHYRNGELMMGGKRAANLPPSLHALPVESEEPVEEIEVENAEGETPAPLDPPTAEELVNDNLKAELVAMAEAMGMVVDPAWTKPVIAAEIVKARDAAAQS